MNVHRLINPAIRRGRRKRMQAFAARFGITRSTRILDVGGTTFNWLLLDVRPQVTLLNLSAESMGPAAETFTRVVADGCALPFADAAFDVVFSNSLIEHLPPERQRHLATEIVRVGRAHFVQTPNYWFPVEPHFWAPFFHWLPRAARHRTVRWLTPWGLLVRPSPSQARQAVDEMRLLTRAELRAHFPGSEIRVERAVGLAKSLIASGP